MANRRIAQGVNNCGVYTRIFRMKVSNDNSVNSKILQILILTIFY